MRTAVFLTMILSINRTISLVFPFRRSLYRTPIIIVSIFITFLTAQLIFTNYWGFRVRYNTYLVSCMWSGDPDKNPSLRSKSIYLEVSMILTYVIPVLIVTVGCVISTTVLLYNKSAAGNTTLHRKYRASTTIVIFTTFYLLFNIPQVPNYRLVISKVIIVHGFKIFGFGPGSISLKPAV